MKPRSLLALAAACALATGCDGLKEAFSAHTNVVARAGSRELTVTDLGNLIGKATIQIPPSQQVADVVAGFWVDYQLLAQAAARGDSLTNQAEIDEATRSYTNGLLLRKLSATVDSMLVPDRPSEAGYNQAIDGVYDARHILFQFPPRATPAQMDSVRRKAAGVRAQVTDRNFADMAQKYSSDVASARQGGNLGPFNKGTMVAEFYDAVAGLKPGEISQPVKSQYGYHIVQRLTYAEAKNEYDSNFAQVAGADAERSYMAKLDSTANIQVKSGAVGLAKVATLDPASHRKDDAVMATFNGGTLTVGSFLLWVDQFSPNQQVPQKLQSAPDSLVTSFVKAMATQQLLLHKADSMHVTLSPDERQGIYHDFAQVVSLSWQALGIDPKTLADSAKGTQDRQRIAAARVDTLLADVMAGKGQPVPIPSPLKALLETKYSWKINATAVGRAADLAQRVRTSADSARAANQPQSQVPLPGMTPPGGSPGTKKP